MYIAFPHNTHCGALPDHLEVSEQNELRTEDWKKGQAMLRACGMTDLEGDVALFQDLLRYAKLADVAYAGDEEPVLVLDAAEWQGSSDSGNERSRNEDTGVFNKGM